MNIREMSDVELFENYKIERYWAKKEREVNAKIGSLVTIALTFICYIITSSWVFGGICFVIFFLIIGTHQGNHQRMEIALYQEIQRRRYDKK